MHHAVPHLTVFGILSRGIIILSGVCGFALWLCVLYAMLTSKRWSEDYPRLKLFVRRYILFFCLGFFICVMLRFSELAGILKLTVPQ